jgi:rhodanese-related sulfurtransferase
VNCEDSEFLANELFNLGYMPIYVYKGGIEDWKSRQMPVETVEEEAGS